MSMLGSSFGRALSAGGGAVAALANQYVTAELQEQKLQFMSELEKKRAIEMDQYNNSPARREGLRVEAGKDVTTATLAQAGAQRQATVAAQDDAPYQDALERGGKSAAERQARGTVAAGMITAPFQREQKRLDAEDDFASMIERAKKLQGDPAARQALWNQAMNDPRIKGQYLSYAASAGASAAHQKMLGAQFDELIGVGARAKELRGLQGQLATEKDPTKRDEIQRQITDLGFAGKDPSKFLALAEKAQEGAAKALSVMTNPLASEEDKGMARSQMERMTELANKAAAMGGVQLGTKGSEDPVLAQLRRNRALKAGIPPAAADHLRNNPHEAPSFDAHFGKGMAAKMLAGILPGDEAEGHGVFKGGDPGDRASWAPKAQADRPPKAKPGAREPDDADRATQARQAAEREVAKWGSRQRQQDPQGFERVSRALAEAIAAERRAFDQVAPNPDRAASFRMSTP